jgi:hypothetical protein
MHGADKAKALPPYKNTPNEIAYPMASSGSSSGIIDQVAPFIHDLCRMDRFGGRCVRKEIGLWEVLDIHSWSEEHVTALRQRFPSISARVEANRKSLGGFCVILQQHRASHAWIAMLVCGVMVSVVFSLARLTAFHH